MFQSVPVQYGQYHQYCVSYNVSFSYILYTHVLIALILQDSNTHQVKASRLFITQVSTGIHVLTSVRTNITDYYTLNSTVNTNARMCHVRVTNPRPQFHVLGTMSRITARENKRLPCSGIEPETTRQHDVYSRSQFFL